MEREGDGRPDDERAAEAAEAAPAHEEVAPDPVLDALDALGDSLEASAADEKALGEQVRQLRAGRLEGLSWRDAMDRAEGSEVLDLLGKIVRRLTAVGAVLRRALAVVLVDEGASTAEVAHRFGVSRQRIFRLLRGNPTATDDEQGD